MALNLFYLGMLGLVAADIPAHCLQEQSLGTWGLSLSNSTNDRSEIGFSGEVDSLRTKCSLAPGTNKLLLTLTPPNVAMDSEGNRGTWTMVYDQGFEVQINGKVYFQFSNYEADGNITTSYCGKSLPAFAWYHDAAAPGKEAKNWGCYTSRLITPHTQTQLSATRTHRMPTHQGIMLGTPLPDLWMRERPRAVIDERPDDLKYAGLPEAFDWEVKGYMAPIRDQLTCGSCYSFAGTAMLESRARIKSAKALADNMMLAPQSLVSCSSYTQQCEGGFAYLVAKFAQDFTIASNKCFPYEAGIVADMSDASLQPRYSKQCDDPAHHYRAYDAHYVGGYFGNCSEVSTRRGLTAGQLL
jgi:cathepsin C